MCCFQRFQYLVLHHIFLNPSQCQHRVYHEHVDLVILLHGFPPKPISSRGCSSPDTPRSVPRSDKGRLLRLRSPENISKYSNSIILVWTESVSSTAEVLFGTLSLVQCTVRNFRTFDLPLKITRVFPLKTKEFLSPGTIQVLDPPWIPALLTTIVWDSTTNTVTR